MNQKLVKFALGSEYEQSAKSKEYLFFVLLGLVMHSIEWLCNEFVNYGFNLLFFVFWILGNIFVFPTGRYIRFTGEYPERIGFWPKVFGLNVWLYAVAPGILVARLAGWGWYVSAIAGIVFAVTIPVLWKLMTHKITIEQEPEQ